LDQIVNTEQAQAWNGYEGGHWASFQDRYDAVNSGFNPALLTAAAIDRAERVLDIGCGNGQTTRLAAQRAAEGEVVGIDLSAPILERARATARAQGLTNITHERGDAQVHPFPVGGFDVAISRFGVMFFADPVAAFGNIGRSLRPGGRLAFLCLRELASSELGPVLAAMSPHLPHPWSTTATTGRGAFSLADPEHTRAVLEQAGYRQVDIAPVDAPQAWGRDAPDAAAFLAAWGPVRQALRATAGAGHAEQACAELTRALLPHQTADGVRLRGTAWLVQARRPG